MKKKKFFPLSMGIGFLFICSQVCSAVFLYQQMLLKAHQDRLFPENMPLL